MVNKGVKAFKMPASVLVIFVSAIQKRNAGKKLPNNPETKMTGRLSFGICLNDFKLKGRSTNPALIILRHAT